MKASESFVYTPEFDYTGIDIHDSDAIIKALQPFAKDLYFFIQVHIVTADALRKMIRSSKQVTVDTRNTFLNHLKEIDHHISQIIATGQDLRKDMSEEAIDENAHKNYYQEFEGTNILPAKLDFMKLLRLYQVLKFYNHYFSEHWNALKKIFGDIEVTSHNHKFLQQILIFKIYSRLNLVGLVELLTRRLHFILRITQEKRKEASYLASGEYSSTIRYSFSTIFDPRVTKVIFELNKLTSQRDQDKSQKDANAIKSWKEAVGSCLVNELTIDCRCDEVFNQGFFQTMNISSYRLQIEEAKVKRSVYIETRMGIEEKLLRREIARSLISKFPPEEKIEKYNTFLEGYFSLQMSSLMVYFPNLAPDEQKLFMYHFAPTYFLRVVINHMKESRIGFIHHFTKKDTMLRELPFEYVKMSLGHWWDDNIYKKIPRPEKNSKDKYENFVQLLVQLWEKDHLKVTNQINKNLHAKRAFELHNLIVLKPFLQEKLSHLFYLLYTRFLGQDFVYYIQDHKKRKLRNKA